jgi:NTE family protein
MYKGDSFYEWIKELLAEKGVHTFHDLISDDPDEQQTFKYRWRLKVIASDVSNSRMIKLPTDAQLYGLEPDDMEVATAVRMSMSIPFFFRPMIFKTTQVANLPYVPKWLRPTVNKNNYIVDGGLLSNFPIWMWDSDGTPDWPTFGLLLSDKSDTQPNEVDGLMSFFVAIFKTMMKAHDKRFIKPEDYFHRTIAIPTGQIMSTDFNIVNAEKELLYQSGYDYRKWAIKQRGL